LLVDLLIYPMYFNKSTNIILRNNISVGIYICQYIYVDPIYIIIYISREYIYSIDISIMRVSPTLPTDTKERVGDNASPTPPLILYY